VPTLEKTNQAHFLTQDQFLGGRLMCRNPNQVSLDGNTVEFHLEQAKYAESAIQYQASLEFTNGGFTDLILALRGQ
jgi:flagellar basal-body rod protein FlgB